MNILAQYGADERRHFDIASENGLTLARVVSQHRSLYELVTETGIVPAEVSGRYRHEAAHPADYPAVGDFVLVPPANTEGGQTLIQRLLPRKSVFLRRAAGSDAYTQVVAANIDVAFLCMVYVSVCRVSVLSTSLLAGNRGEFQSPSILVEAASRTNGISSANRCV